MIYHLTLIKKVAVAILISNRADFRAKKVIRDKEGYYIMIKGSVCQDDIIILNVHMPDIRGSNYMKQKLIKLQGEIDESTVKVRDFNITLIRNGQIQQTENQLRT